MAYYHQEDSNYHQQQHDPHHQQQHHQHHHQQQYVDRYASYQQSDLNYPPPPSDSLSNQDYNNHTYQTTYPPDHYYHPDQGYHPDYQSDYNQQHPYGLDEKPPPSDLYPPLTAAPAGKPLSHSPSFAAFDAPTRGSVAAQMAAEGAIPEKAGLRMWRSDERSGAFTRGGKSKSCGRCCCCTSIVIVLVIVGLIAGFLLWVRPPNATFNGIAPPTAGNQVDLQPNGFLLNFDLNIGVTNPNFFGATFSQISAKAYYPLNTTAALGGGELNNVDIKPHSNTTINFPFQINYTTSLDPNRAILADIANRCGFLGAAKSPIKISFDITLRLKVLAITISPTFSSSNTFSCPLKQSDFTSVLGGSQSLDALSNMLTGSSGSTAANPANAAPKKVRRLVRRSSSALVNDVDQDTLEEDRQIQQLLLKVFSQPSSHHSPAQINLSDIRIDSSRIPRFSLTPLTNYFSSLQRSPLISSFFPRLTSSSD